MDDMNNLQKALDEIFGKMNIVPADPEEHYTEQVREIFRIAHKQGLIDCIPKVTGHFNRATGEMNVRIETQPKEIDLIQVKVTYDGEKFSY